MVLFGYFERKWNQMPWFSTTCSCVRMCYRGVRLNVDLYMSIKTSECSTGTWPVAMSLTYFLDKMVLNCFNSIVLVLLHVLLFFEGHCDLVIWQKITSFFLDCRSLFEIVDPVFDLSQCHMLEVDLQGIHLFDDSLDYIFFKLSCFSIN